MAMKDYSDEFKADAVALYESTPGATYKRTPPIDGVDQAGRILIERLLEQCSTHCPEGPGHDQADARSYTCGTQPCLYRGGLPPARFLCHGDTLWALQLRGGDVSAPGPATLGG